MSPRHPDIFQSQQPPRHRTAPILRIQDLLRLLLLVVVCIPTQNVYAFQSSIRAESIESYLENHALNDLVVTYLEEELQQALGDAQFPIAERIASFYGKMFDAAGSIEEREVWAQKSADLLEKVPDVDTPALRLNLAKAKYLRAEAVAEQYRIRTVDHREMLIARRMMTEAAGAFEDEFRAIRTKVRRIEHLKIDPRDTVKAQATEKQLAELDALASQSAYYAAWARYYEGWLANDPDKLALALKMFGWVLQNQTVEPILEEFPESLLSFEHIARATLGVALTLSADKRSSAALDWIDTLKADHTNPAVKAQYPAYLLSLLFDRADIDIAAGITPNWINIQNHLQERNRSAENNDATFARLLAIRALQAAEASGGDPVARQLAGNAIAQLSQMNQLSQVLEIAELFDLDVLGKNSFAIAYVLALKTHERARQQHGSDEPTTHAGIIALYTESQKQLRAAATRSDATQFQSAASHALLLAAWAQYFCSDFQNAAQAFIKAAPHLDLNDRETAYWMRIVSLDRSRKQPNSKPDKSLLLTALREYISEFPSSPRSGRVRYQLTLLEDGPPTLAKVETLLSIPLNSDAYQYAQRGAEQMLYTLFHSAKPTQRIELGHRYLNIALPLVNETARAVFSGSYSTDTENRYITYSRRVLEILLNRGISRISEARKVLDRLETSSASGLLDLTEFRVELNYRRFQILLLSGNYDLATQRCDEIWAADPGSTFAAAAIRELITRDLQDFHAFPNDSGSFETLKRILNYGQRLLDAKPDDPDLADSETLALVAGIAEASHALQKRGYRKDELRPQAKALYAQLLSTAPSNFVFIKASAELAEEDQEFETALTLWRQAITRIDATDLRWYESKYHLIRILIQTDRIRAQAVMQQHELLNPTYGPSPWGEKIALLAQELAQPAPNLESTVETPDGEQNDG